MRNGDIVVNIVSAPTTETLEDKAARIAESAKKAFLTRASINRVTRPLYILNQGMREKAVDPTNLVQSNQNSSREGK
jgi:hypothetical protein